MNYLRTGLIGLRVGGDAARIKSNRFDSNGFAAGVPNGLGLGIYAFKFATPPVGLNTAHGNDDPNGCYPASVC
jgi:hypothetical protein